MAVIQLIILLFPDLYNGNYPIIACTVEYGIFILADLVGWLGARNPSNKTNSGLTPQEVTYVVNSCRFSLAITDLPAFAVTGLFLLCAWSQGNECVSFPFLTGASGAITVLNNFSYATVQAIFRREQPMGIPTPAQAS